VLEHGDHGQREGRGLAGAGLRDAEHVAARQHVRDGLLLDGGGGGVTGRLHGGKNLGRKAELGKSHVTSNRRPLQSLAALDDETMTKAAGEGPDVNGRTVQIGT